MSALTTTPLSRSQYFLEYGNHSYERLIRLNYLLLRVTTLLSSICLPFRAMEGSDSEKSAPKGSATGEGTPGGDTPRDPPPLGPLPSGRHRFSRKQVAHHQRERLIAGFAGAVAERGYAAVTIGQIAAAAHVSRRAFYQHFATKEECFAAAFDVVFAHLRTVMADAVAPYKGDWARQVAAAIKATLDFFAAEPDLARLCLVESPSAGPELQRRFGEVAAVLGPSLRAGRDVPEASRDMTDSIEQSLVGTVGARLNREIALNGPEGLPELLPDLVEFVLTPYLGAEDARRYATEVTR
jgi:AcrR family transcriptional regulator